MPPADYFSSFDYLECDRVPFLESNADAAFRNGCKGVCVRMRAAIQPPACMKHPAMDTSVRYDLYDGSMRMYMVA